MANTVTWYEDYTDGYELTTNSRTVGETEIVFFSTFVGLHEGPFLSEVDAARWPFGGRRVSPGILTMVLAEGLVTLTGLFYMAGISFQGFQETRVIAPVVMGDTIHVKLTIAGMRPNPQKHRGRITYQHEVVNQRGETVMIYKVARLIAMRPAEKAEK